jgi:hypothetical protein
MIKSYLSLAQVHSGDSFLFRSLSKTKLGFRLREINQPISYTRAREVILDALKPFVNDVSSFGVHSLRAGGATAAAQAGISDRLFKRHGRWESEGAKDGYVKDNKASLLSVSKALGLD